jgi:SAM-dependent methyltransferase
MDRVPEEIVEHYDREIDEAQRITEGLRQLELLRTREIVRRHLPSAPRRILDVGGGAGVHATWLAGDGHHVHLIDPVPRHVEQARQGGITAELGDARQLRFAGASFDAVLLFGPLYHLTDAGDRVGALREAARVVDPDGLVFVAAISRFASLFDGLARGSCSTPISVRSWSAISARASTATRNAGRTGSPPLTSTIPRSCGPSWSAPAWRSWSSSASRAWRVGCRSWTGAGGMPRTAS